MIGTYWKYGSLSFQNSMVYRLNTLVSIINTIISIFVYTAIWKSLYSGGSQPGDPDLPMVITHFVISLGLSTVLMNMMSDVPWKINSGDIASDLLRPVNFQLFLLAKTLGEISFKLLLQFLPACVLSFFVLGMLPPASGLHFLLFLFSLASGFLVYFLIDYLIALSAFWLHRVFFIQQFKGALITIFSGALFPIWFLPPMLQKMVAWTPFKYIYFIPVSIYLDSISMKEALTGIMIQWFWILLLFLIGEGIWKRGIRKLVIQGG